MFQRDTTSWCLSSEKQSKIFWPTVMINWVYEPKSHMSMIAGHQNHIKELFTVWVQISESSIHCLHRLEDRNSISLIPSIMALLDRVRIQ